MSTVGTNDGTIVCENGVRFDTCTRHDCGVLVWYIAWFLSEYF